MISEYIGEFKMPVHPKRNREMMEEIPSAEEQRKVVSEQPNYFEEINRAKMMLERAARDGLKTVIVCCQPGHSISYYKPLVELFKKKGYECELIDDSVNPSSLKVELYKMKLSW